MKFVFYLLIIICSVTSSTAQEKVAGIPYFLFNDFENGIVLMKSGAKYTGLLNYNILAEELIYKDNGKILAVGKEDVEKMDTVFIGDRKFLALNGRWVELLYHSDYELFAEHKCKLTDPGKRVAYGGTSYTAATDSYSSFYSGGRMYKLDLPDYETKRSTNYWLNKKGELHLFIKTKQLAKIYQGKEQLIKEYTRTHEVNFENPESIIQLVKYLESN